MPAKAFRTSKTFPAKSAETVVPVTTFPPSGLQVITVPFAAAADPGHRVFHNLPVRTMIVVRFQTLTMIFYNGITGDDAVKMIRMHTVPQSLWQGNVCENANVTDQYNAK